MLTLTSHGEMTKETVLIFTGCCVLVVLIVFINYINILKN